MGNVGEARIEALEHQLMRTWLEGDRKQFKTMLASRFRLVVGARTPVLLDRKSLVEAVGAAWRLDAYRFGTSIYVRKIGSSTLFAAEIELKGRVDGTDVSGTWWLADYWQRSTVTRRWQLADRQLARLEEGPAVPAAVRGLQLWR